MDSLASIPRLFNGRRSNGDIDQDSIEKTMVRVHRLALVQYALHQHCYMCILTIAKSLFHLMHSPLIWLNPTLVFNARISLITAAIALPLACEIT